MKEKNLIIAIGLSLVVMIGWSLLVEKKIIPGAPSTSAGNDAVGGVRKKNDARPSTPAAGSKASAASASPKVEREATSPEASSSAKTPEPAMVRTANAEVQLSTHRASITSYRYHGPLGWIELTLAPGLLQTDGAGVFTANAASGPGVVFEGAGLGQVRPRKEFEFRPEGEFSRLRVKFRNEGRAAADLPAWSLQIGPGLGTVESEKKENPKLWRAIGLFPPDEGKTQPKLDELKAGERTGPWKWLAIDNRYFLVAALASASDFEKFRLESVTTDGHPAPLLKIVAKPARLAPGEEKTVEIPFYIGPKSYSKLEKLGVGLERSVNFGWFDTLGRWTLKLLDKLHGITGNYGWSIILLTVLIQTALFPLTFKSLQSMAKMRRVQPEIAKLQQKYKEDAQRLNAEMMQLYKAKGVNPMGGCLPMLAQMPIFVALFNALRNAWELHGASWIFWVKDLSAHDPFYILPLVMGGVMYLQNQLNPAATADPAQANMMKFMPVIFTFMFANFPAGLVLYWLTNSVLSTVQQLALRKQLS